MHALLLYNGKIFHSATHSHLNLDVALILIIYYVFDCLLLHSCSAPIVSEG